MGCVDHRYEPGAYGVCRRCGGERPTRGPGFSAAAVALATKRNRKPARGRVMGAKHTPGPWVAETIADDFGLAVIASDEADRISNPSRGMVCHISTVAGASGDDSVLAAANARLIAAAPDLLEACRLALPSNLCVTNRVVTDGTVVSLDVTIGDLRKIAAAIAKATGGQGQ